jgi:hypothetical protein
MRINIEIRQATTPKEREAFVKFPWRVYKDDPNWVPPLISDQLTYLDPQKNVFFTNAEVVLFTAYRDDDLVGTIAAFVDHHLVEQSGQPIGGFGFFEVIDDYDISRQLLTQLVSGCARVILSGCEVQPALLIMTTLVC